MTKSLHIVIRDLKLEQVYVIYPGTQSYEIDRRVRAVTLADLQALV